MLKECIKMQIICKWGAVNLVSINNLEHLIASGLDEFQPKLPEEMVLGLLPCELCTLRSTGGCNLDPLGGSTFGSLYKHCLAGSFVG